VLINVDPVPAAIVTYYAANGAFAAPETVVNIPLIAQKDASNYTYLSLNLDAANEMYLCHGTVDSVNGVNETWRELVPFGFRTGIIYGALGASGSITQVQYGIAQALQTCALIINQSSTFNIDGFEQGRGILGSDFRNTSTGALGGTTEIMNPGAITFRDGRVFEVQYFTNSFGSVANTTIYTLHYNNAAGATIDGQTKQNPPGTALVDHVGSFFVKNDTGADLSRTLSLCAAPNAGTVTISFAGAVSRMYVKDLGPLNQQINIDPVALA
jgi:hypothetical protein